MGPSGKKKPFQCAPRARTAARDRVPGGPVGASLRSNSYNPEGGEGGWGDGTGPLFLDADSQTQLTGV